MITCVKSLIISSRNHLFNNRFEPYSQVRFIHKTTGQALKFSMKTYPDWGFHQHEVCADKLVDQVDTVWNVEEHRYTKSECGSTCRMRNLYLGTCASKLLTNTITWNISSFSDDEDKKALEKELYSHELIPQRPTHLSFWQKFSELQIKMLLTNQVTDILGVLTLRSP